MKCPVCKKGVLESEDVIENLKTKVCRLCNGRWIQSFQYWKWLDRHGQTLQELPAAEAGELPPDDSPAGKLCPECGHFLTQRKVGHGADFHLDRCNCCGGIWFDKNEWETLHSRNLHDKVHFVFSAAWQKQVRDEESSETFEKRIKSILGQDDYEKLKQTAAWINSHPQKNTILSYMMNWKP
jgi:Zn-finger nucleic acid-binding protein